MSLTIKEVTSEKDIKKFVLLPFSLYKGNKNWAPPIIKDEIKALNPAKNPAFDYSEAKFWIALDGDKCVGRIGAVINKEYNKKTGKKWPVSHALNVKTIRKQLTN